MKEVIAWKTKENEYQVLINTKLFIVDEDSIVDIKTMSIEDGLVDKDWMDKNYTRLSLKDLPQSYIDAIKEKLKSFKV
jgi:hypothetical protein